MHRWSLNLIPGNLYIIHLSFHGIHIDLLVPQKHFGTSDIILLDPIFFLSRTSLSYCIYKLVLSQTWTLHLYILTGNLTTIIFLHCLNAWLGILLPPCVHCVICILPNLYTMNVWPSISWYVTGPQTNRLHQNYCKLEYYGPVVYFGLLEQSHQGQGSFC